MKFCDKRIQKHLLNGGKIKRESCNFLMFLGDDGLLCYQSNGCVHTCCISKKDLTADDWEIVEPEYNWDKIIKDKVLCVFWDDESYSRVPIVVGLLSKVNENKTFRVADRFVSFQNCKPFNPADFNIAKDLKEYEK